MGELPPEGFLPVASGAAESPLLEVVLRHRLGSLSLEIAFSTASRQLVLFGPSGAGKTTILRSIAGLFRPAEARIRMAGRTLTDSAQHIALPPRKRRVGLVSQKPALFPHMSAAANVAFGLQALSRAHRAARVAEVLRIFAAEEFAGRRPGELSGGERQRVALARAAAPLPGLLLLDEPLTGMDGTLRTELLARMQPWLQAHSIATVYVTHDVAEVFELGADVVVIAEGRVVRQGSAATVLAFERARILTQLGAQLGAQCGPNTNAGAQPFNPANP